MISRRAIILTPLSFPIFIESSFGSSRNRRLIDIYQNPRLKLILSRNPRADCDTDGACGPNRKTFERVEYQRDGTEAIISGIVVGRGDWIAAGWRMLDWGSAHLNENASPLSRGDWFHVISLFVEALARALIIDPKRSTNERRSALKLGADWLLKYEQEGMRANAPLTHRFFILFAALGQCHSLLHDDKYQKSAWRWANRGFALQADDGTNPELGGFDASYQIVGPLFAMRYYPSCHEAEMQTGIRIMVERAMDRWLKNVEPDGNVRVLGSTRIGREIYNGVVKQLNYYEAFQALIFAGAILSEPRFTQAADAVRPHAFRLLGIRN